MINLSYCSLNSLFLNVKKLDFLERMATWADRLDRPTLLVGDFNIAPLDCDVYDHKALLKVVSHTPIETEGLLRIQQKGKWVDLMRQHVPAEKKLYTWWSYRAADWKVSNRGRRLDHWWADKRAAPLVDIASYKIHTDERGGEKPSDHVPVTVTVTAAA